MLKYLRKGNNRVFRRCQKISNVQRLKTSKQAVKKVNIGQKAKSTNDVLPGSNGTSHVRIMSLEVEMHELRSA